MGPRQMSGLSPGFREAYRNYFKAVGADGDDLAFALNFGLLAGAEHERDVRAIDVSVEQADAVAHLAERESEIDGQRGFADSTFAGADGDDGTDARERLRGGHLLAGMGMRAHRLIIREGNTGSGHRVIGPSGHLKSKDRAIG